MKYFSMFSGIGGFEKGIEDAFNSNERASVTGVADVTGDLSDIKGGVQEGGYRATCIGLSEIDKNAINIYLKHYPGHRNYGSAFDIKTADLPDFDFLVGGFPCQAFSIAGKRLGFDDTRGTLFFEIARVLREKRPSQFLLENVKGLLSHDNGKTFRTIISTLTEMGYCVEWEVLNSKNFGVPQNRERVFIHGFREGCGRQIFPLGTFDGETSSSVKEASKIIDPKYLMRDCTITDICPTMAKRDYKEPFIVAQEQIKATQGLSDAQRVREIDGFRIRRLTPIECERLQGFPDDWTKYGADGKTMSDSSRYKACGNAVTTNVIRAIFTELINPSTCKDFEKGMEDDK